jgi:hypothetical protein
MQTLPSRPASGVLYENFWIVYDEESFNTCNINKTYKSKENEMNNKLHNCDTPDILQYYNIDFKERSPVNSGILFQSGRYYYFLGKYIIYR